MSYHMIVERKYSTKKLKGGKIMERRIGIHKDIYKFIEEFGINVLYPYLMEE